MTIIVSYGCAACAAELHANQARMDLRDPWPTLRATMTLVARQHERAALLGPPPDPDGLSLPARIRLAQSLVLSAYLHLLDHATRVVALGWLYGAENVLDATGEHPAPVAGSIGGGGSFGGGGDRGSGEGPNGSLEPWIVELRAFVDCARSA